MQTSSFTRRVPSSSVESGTRPGLHGQTLISSGHSDLDRLLGGGLPLGSLVLLTEDLHSSQHLNLMRYFMAEGVTLGQRVAWLAPRLPPGGPGLFLPAEASPSSSSSHARVEAPMADLKIAWQYQKYIKTDTSHETHTQSAHASQAAPKRPPVNAVEAGIGRVWCRTFDLMKPMSVESVDKSGMVTRDCCSCPSSSRSPQGLDTKPLLSPHDPSCPQPGSCGEDTDSGVRVGLDAALESSLSFTRPFVPSQPWGYPSIVGSRAPWGSESVGRLVVQSLGTIDWRIKPMTDSSPDDPHDAEIEILRFLIRLRSALRDTRCTALVTLPSALFSPSAMVRMQHVADCVLSLDTISDDSEVFRLIPDASAASALLTLSKAPSVGACVAPRVADNTIHVVRNKRKKISITAVELDPDAEEKGQAKAPSTPSLEF